MKLYRYHILLGITLLLGGCGPLLYPAQGQIGDGLHLSEGFAYVNHLNKRDIHIYSMPPAPALSCDLKTNEQEDTGTITCSDGRTGTFTIDPFSMGLRGKGVLDDGSTLTLRMGRYFIQQDQAAQSTITPQPTP